MSIDEDTQESQPGVGITVIRHGPVYQADPWSMTDAPLRFRTVLDAQLHLASSPGLHSIPTDRQIYLDSKNLVVGKLSADDYISLEHSPTGRCQGTNTADSIVMQPGLAPFPMVSPELWQCWLTPQVGGPHEAARATVYESELAKTKQLGVSKINLEGIIRESRLNKQERYPATPMLSTQIKADPTQNFLKQIEAPESTTNGIPKSLRLARKAVWFFGLLTLAICVYLVTEIPSLVRSEILAKPFLSFLERSRGGISFPASIMLFYALTCILFAGLSIAVIAILDSILGGCFEWAWGGSMSESLIGKALGFLWGNWEEESEGCMALVDALEKGQLEAF